LYAPNPDHGLGRHVSRRKLDDLASRLGGPNQSANAAVNFQRIATDLRQSFLALLLTHRRLVIRDGVQFLFKARDDKIGSQDPTEKPQKIDGLG